MARIICKMGYYKPNRMQKAGGYVQYIATRLYAERIDESKKYSVPTKEQEKLIAKLIKDFPNSQGLDEYKDYRNQPTVENAHEFISRCMEENFAHMASIKTYADYIATRPRAEKFGSHALFSDESREIVLSQVSNELNEYKGNIYTAIVSLRREDATRLGFNNGSRWRDMLRNHTQELAQSLRIPYTHLKWYAAFHNEGNHPHVHIIAYSSEPKEGYLTKKGIDRLRASLARDIFAEDLRNIYEEQTSIRNELKNEWKEIVRNAIESLSNEDGNDEELVQKLTELSERLRKTSGKKVYGYLKKDVKGIIDSIVELLGKNENISRLYDLWWKKKCDVLRTYYQNIPFEKPRLSENKEFKSLKNDIIREALKIDFHTPRMYIANSVAGLLRGLGSILGEKINRENIKIPYVDRRHKQEEEQKRNAEFDFSL